MILSLVLAAASLPAWASDTVEVEKAQIELSDDGYKLAAAFSFDLSEELKDALTHGLTLRFNTEVQITKPRWYWFDEKFNLARQTTTIAFNPLTRQYHVSVNGGFQQRFTSLEDALFLIRRPSRWTVAAKGQLKPGDVYNVNVRLLLDREHLSKPLQVNALNNAGWRFESKTKTFSYKAE
nr:DUF4390 domain-containing protein [Massilia sp. TS11]